MSPRDDTRRRRAVAVAGATFVALALVIAVGWHVTDLRTKSSATAKRQMTRAASAAARMVDSWIAERESDATALARVAGIHGSDSTHITPEVAGRILQAQMDAQYNRRTAVAIWMVDAHHKVLGSVGGSPISAAEQSAASRAIAASSLQVSRPERRDSTITVAVAQPIVVNTAHGPEAQGAVIIRSDLSRAFLPEVTGRTPQVSPVIVIPADHQRFGITLCPTPAPTLCMLQASDTLAHLASLTPSSFQTVVMDGQPFLVATQQAKSLPWSVYFAVSEDSQFVAVRDRLRFEALLIFGVLLVVGLVLYAYDRSVHLRRMTDRAQTEARFSAIVNTAMDAIIIVDQTYRIIVVNSAAESMFDYSARSALGRSVLDLIPDASKEELRRALDQTMRAGEQPRLFSADRYAAGRRRDGSTFPIDVSVSRTQIDGLPHLTIVIRDITDWKRAEDSSEWQRRVLESIATGVDLREVLRTIARFHETQCPGVECAIHLIDDDGVTLRMACAPSMRPEFVEAMDEIVIGPNASTCGAAVYRRDQVITPDIGGDRLWNDYRALALEQGYRACWATPIRSPQGRVLGALAMYTRDPRTPTPAELRVTATATQLAGIAVDRAHAAESLRQSEASFRSFVENSPIGIYRATGTGRLLAVNASLVQLLGYNSALELLQVDMGRELFIAGSDRERLLRHLEAHGELRSTEMEWRRKDGTSVTVRISARAYRDERGSVWFSEGFVENVTPLRAAEQALRQSEKLAALGQLVSGVAHELNNPLAAILHFAEDLLEDERTATDLEALSVIRDQARRSRSIVRDLLSFVRFRDASKERVQFADALATGARGLQPAIDEIGAKLIVELPTGEISGLTDRAGLQQIVTNLVVNAAQASGKGGIVRLHADTANDELRIVVEDTGPGIPAALMDRIFEPFFTTKPIGQGTGLGLSVTLGVVQQLGGRIHVENRTPADGGGARFTVILPIRETGETPSAAPPAEPAQGTEDMAAAAHPRALIIDDEPSIRAALRRFFVRRGWEVSEAEDGTEGLATIMSGRFDFAVIVSDLKMPGCSGVELHDHVAAMAPEMLDRIIFSTGDVASKEAAEFVARTRCTVMQKPFELRALEAVVNRLRQMAAAS